MYKEISFQAHPRLQAYLFFLSVAVIQQHLDPQLSSAPKCEVALTP